MVRVARAAEAAGWDGFFTWDHLAFVWGPPSADPWVTLAAVACSTEQLTLGTAVTPLPRRRPQVVAQQLGTLERLNGGRVVFGAGLGGNEKEFTAFDEDFDPHHRAKLLDDGLTTVRGLWPGPIWMGGNSAQALRRAARWDGWIANSVAIEGMTMTAGRARREGDCDWPRRGVRRCLQRVLVTGRRFALRRLRRGWSDLVARERARPALRAGRAAGPSSRGT